MDFTVHAPGGPEEFSGEASYRFDEGGHLVVNKGDGHRRVYSHSGWSYVEEYRDPNASIAGGYV